MDWPSVPLDGSLDELAGQAIAVRGVGPQRDQTTVLLQVDRPRRGQVAVSLCDTATRVQMPEAMRVSAPGEVTLEDLILAHTGVKAEAAARVPRLKWPLLSDPSLQPKLMVASLVFLAIGVLLRQWLMVLPMLASLFASQFVQANRIATGPPRVIDGSRELLPSTVRAHIPDPSAAPLAPTPRDRVKVVKAAYGELLSDIVYRIENSALFDNAFGPTQRFQLALLAWDPDSPDAAGLADEVETAFAEARSAAEAAGLDHLPETARASAGRAVKAATTALSAEAEAERAAARTRVAEILASLALYWLPTVDTSAPSLIGRRREIEPAP